MARRKPDLFDHCRHVTNRKRELLGLMQKQLATRAPSAYWLAPADWLGFEGYLKGGGFDVARGFVFRGAPVLAFRE